MFVYGVYKNADMNEGSGPMVLHKVFEKVEDAKTYVDQQRGVQGMYPEGGFSNQEPISSKPCSDGSYTICGISEWEVRALKVQTDVRNVLKDEQDEYKKRALSKLSDEERKALGFK